VTAHSKIWDTPIISLLGATFHAKNNINKTLKLSMIQEQEIRLLIQEVIEKQVNALSFLRKTIDESWIKAVELIRNCQSKLIVSGVGKSGDIGKKIASSFTSTGTPSLFVCPIEASHGSLGLLDIKDVLLILSNSGSTLELLTITRYAKENKIPIIIITKNPLSPLAQLSDIVLKIPDILEACPNGLAPTCSTTCQLVSGDALMVAVMLLKNFTAENFKKFHPGGNLGKMLISVEEIMYKGNKMPIVPVNVSIKEAIIEMNSKSMGCVGVINHRKQYVGIFTDGDLRRRI
jgi:arabinose-5-phosphate isomerase